MDKVDVLAVLDAVDGWAREVSDEYIDGQDGLRAEYAKDLKDFREVRSIVSRLIATSRRVRDAFAAHGKSDNAIADLATRRECEEAMLALDEALASLAGAP